MKSPKVPTFRLKFDIAKVGYWADRYEFDDDTGVVASGEQAHDRGWYSEDDFLTITGW